MCQQLSRLGLLGALTCRPSVLPRAGIASLVELVDSTSVTRLTDPFCSVLSSWSGQLFCSQSVDVLVHRSSRSLQQLTRRLSFLCWWRRWHVRVTERQVLRVLPFGRVPKICRPLLRCAPSTLANLSCHRGD